MEVLIGNQERLGLDSARQSVTLPQATDQSTLALLKIKNDSTIQPDMQLVQHLLADPKQQLREQNRKRDYEAYWVGYRSDQTTLSNENRVKALRNKIVCESHQRQNLLSQLPCTDELVSEPRSSDYVKGKDLYPIPWYSGLDGRPPARRIEAPQCTVVKPRDKKHEKSSAIAGYLRRKVLAVRRTIVDVQRKVVEKVPKAEESGSAQVTQVSLSNRFALVEDELSDNEDEGTPVDVGQQAAISSVEGIAGSVSEVTQKAAEPEQFEVYDDDFEDIALPSFKKARCLRDKKFRTTYTRLTYYLKCKHFMHAKDPHFIRTLVQDARAWLLKAKCGMETYHEYVLMTSAVMSAFFVDQEELNFRARMKNRREWQALSKHNAACTGDLGWRFGQVEPRFKNLRHAFMTHVGLPSTGMSA